VPAAYAYPLPDGYPDAELAPLLCVGIIGWRALVRANLSPGAPSALRIRRQRPPDHPDRPNPRRHRARAHPQPAGS
jgi:hypothetical protein